MDSKVQFTRRTDGVRIAYTVYGSGEPLVFPAGWISNLGHADPAVREFFGTLAKQFTIIAYDKHGCGLSDRDRTTFTLEAELHDLDTIIEHLQPERFTLFGISSAGPVSVAYTTLHAERVKNLILYGTYSDGKRIVTEEIQSALISLVRSVWGLGSKILAEIFMPDAFVGQGESEIKRLSRHPQNI